MIQKGTSITVELAPEVKATVAGKPFIGGMIKTDAEKGGRTSSLLLTLILVPVMYTKVDEWRVTLPAFFKKIVLRGRPSSVVNVKPVVMREQII